MRFRRFSSFCFSYCSLSSDFFVLLLEQDALTSHVQTPCLEKLDAHATLPILVGGVGYFFDFVDFFRSIILRVIFLKIFLLLLEDDALTSNVQDTSLHGSS